jgi:hypothetical protein
MTNFLHRNDKIVTAQQIFENRSVNLIALCKSFAKIACCWSEMIVTFLLVYAGSNIQNASEQFVGCIHFLL